MKGQSDLIGTVIMIGAVVVFGAALFAIFGSYYLPIQMESDLNLLVARQDAMTTVLGQMSFSNNTFVVVFGRSVERGVLYVGVFGVKSGAYYWRRLVPGIDYALSIVNVSQVGLFDLLNGTSPYWITPGVVGMPASRVYVKDYRLGENNYGYLSNKLGSNYYMTLYKIDVVPGETYLVRVRLLVSPKLLDVDGLLVVFFVRYPGDGCWYMMHTVYFSLK